MSWYVFWFGISSFTLALVQVCLRRVHRPQVRLRYFWTSLILPAAVLLLPDSALLRICLGLLDLAFQPYAGTVPWIGLGLLVSAGAIYTAGRVALVLWGHRRSLSTCWLLDPRAHQDLYAICQRHASTLGIPPPRLMGSARGGSAWTLGVIHPTVVLAEPFLRSLDAEELESVLAHELGHIARRDALLRWTALVFSGLFVYLPTSWVIPRLIEEECEKASDDLAVRLTGKPLPLAGAIIKAWRQARSVAPLRWYPAIGGRRGALEARLRRLLGEQATLLTPAAGTRWTALCAPAAVAVILLLAGLDIVAHSAQASTRSEWVACDTGLQAATGIGAGSIF
ncbi:MAG: M56 family metallopeptidase [candidate division NC10 bacterium]|nr:M56 family metallopeptidase [candidate division NC10 bacterium]